MSDREKLAVHLYLEQGDKEPRSWRKSKADYCAKADKILSLLAEGPVNPKGEPEQSPSKIQPPEAL